jgi:hypothetical protein
MHPTATVHRRAASFGGGRVDSAADRGTLEVAAWGSSGVAREATREVRIGWSRSRRLPQLKMVSYSHCIMDCSGNCINCCELSADCIVRPSSKLRLRRGFELGWTGCGIESLPLS